MITFKDVMKLTFSSPPKNLQLYDRQEHLHQEEKISRTLLDSQTLAVS